MPIPLKLYRCLDHGLMIGIFLGIILGLFVVTFFHKLNFIIAILKPK